MAKIIDIDGATVLAPESVDVVAAAEAAQAVVPDIAQVLVNDDATATQVNLRLAPASLDERAVLVEELRTDLDARIAALDLPADSILLTNLAADQTAVRATPAGLATVGIGLLENLSANRANLTYLALMLAGIFLVARFRSASRALLALVPVLLAVGVSSLIVGLLGFELSPLTTVSGPLVIASCAEFSVLILGRYLEERQRGLAPRDATNTAASRTGRAFFTSAMTTIGGFAVLIGSALPLLRDFGIIVTLNVAIALLAALVVMPPLAVWVDEKGWLGTQEQEPNTHSVRLGALLPGKQTPAALVAIVALIAGAIAVYATADTSSGESTEIAYAGGPAADHDDDDHHDHDDDCTRTDDDHRRRGSAAPRPSRPAHCSTPRTIPPNGRPNCSTASCSTSWSVAGTYTGQGVDPQAANCAVGTVIERYGSDALLAELPTQEPAAVEATKQAAIDCGLDPAVIDGALAEFSGG